ncbi:hypothetical protein PC116_g18159 [Phytophthora cactorum]|uniref:Uncharacterized protein n=1 Tax=Phytophthora cactorum TaxID=29920 RepID=A0A8T1D6X6_9STRA|nr:hypothetical protein PC114_g15915 [Phytophthora cactorum]KAG2934864.1 hypothetical protein PC117_g12549 [Phytophthora cactorum]KAG3004658.1 hypothetical protein PC119_g15547 [Phytophthora cactorum]KAG3027771.1 hypothetical protein PC120_g5233 [Phytophthora cactorum]KAG3145819.1 hypothetical protein C6341_g18247 [Phytophthora cactorum]
MTACEMEDGGTDPSEQSLVCALKAAGALESKDPSSAESKDYHLRKYHGGHSWEFAC